MAQERQASFGPNAWLVDEMYDRYRADPTSVSESWRDFFADYRAAPQVAEAPDAPSAPAAAGPRASVAPAAHPTVAPADARPLRGAAARLVANMEASLAVPTATS